MTKSQPTPKAPQNAPKLTPEQQVRMQMIQEKGEAAMELLDGLTYAEAGAVLKTIDNMLQSQIQVKLSELTIGGTNGTEKDTTDPDV